MPVFQRGLRTRARPGWMKPHDELNAEKAAMGQPETRMVDVNRNREILFESSSNSIVVFHSPVNTCPDSCVVLFSAWSGRALCGKFGGTDPLLREGVDVISIQSNCDDWHQGIPPEIYDNLAQILNDRYLKKYGYGSSMGGFGALLFASRLSLDVVLAMSPQYTIQDDFDKRWRLYSDRIQWRYAMADTARTYKGEIFVTYDPHHIDAEHFSLIEDNFNLAKVTGIPVKFAAHPTTSYFHESQVLKSVVIDILLKGEIPEFSKNNKKNKIYLLSLSQYLLNKRKKVSSALKVAKICLDLDDKRHSLFRHMSDLYSRIDDLERSVEYAQSAVDAKDNDGSSIKTHLEHLSNVQRCSGDLEGALATIDTLIELDCKRSTAHMKKSLILLASNDRDGAINSALEAVKLGDERHWTFRHLSNLYHRLDAVESSVEYAQRAVDAKDNNDESVKSHLEHLAIVQRKYSAQ